MERGSSQPNKRILSRRPKPQTDLNVKAANVATTGSETNVKEHVVAPLQLRGLHIADNHSHKSPKTQRDKSPKSPRRDGNKTVAFARTHSAQTLSRQTLSGNIDAPPKSVRVGGKANIGRFVIAGLMYSKSIEMPEAVHILLGNDRAKAFLNEISIEQLLQNVRKGEAKSFDNVQVMKTALLKHAFAISLWLEFIRDGKPVEQHNSAELGAMKKELNRRIADSHLFGGEETKDWLADRGAKIRSLLGIGDDADNFIDELREFIYPLADHERLAEYSENRQNLKDRLDREQRPSKEGEGSNFIFQDKGES